MTYFQRNPQRTPQWNPRRRNGHTDSGVVVVHTFEAPAGRTCTWGANFLRTRTDYGSYHWLADALGYTLHLAPWSAETWHETTVNNWSVGISMMAYAANWRKITPAQRRNLIHGAALGAHRYSRWRVSQGKSAVPARRISRAQALARVPGFIGHGEIDTKRRTDPGAHFPWNDFLAEYARLESRTPASNVSPTTPTSPGRDWFDMATKQDLRDVVTEAMTVELTDAQMSALATGRRTWAITDLLGVLAHRAGITFQRTEHLPVLREDSIKLKTALQETQENSRLLPRMADKVEKTNHAAGRLERHHGTSPEGN